MWFAVVTLAGLMAQQESRPAVDAPVSYERDVRPILAENCFHCHGQDSGKRRAGMRLDNAAGAISPAKGDPAIVPGHPEKSPLWARITTTDPDDLMPPPDSHRAITPAQRETLRRWIASGAVYETHWAFVPPRRPAVPALKRDYLVRGPIDAFVQARLETEGLSPAPEAPAAVWLRRASFDLDGRAPSLAEMDAFTADVAARGEAAYADAADRLLASPHFGERMAQEWLDVARYADTHGFNNDAARSMWRWRDWVIDAFARDMPYDRFLTEQLAGDLLPGATMEQRLATGFGRNHVINSEGGIIDEEYRTEYVADRVRTLGLAWLGLTVECARCHDHKFDPISQRDYFRLFAFFDNVAEHGEDGRVANAAPLMAAPTAAQTQRMGVLEAELGAAQTKLAASLASHPPATLVDRLRALAASAPALPAGEVFAESPAPPGGGRELGKTLAGDKPWTLGALLRWEGGAGPVISNLDWGPGPAAAEHGRGIELRIAASGAPQIRMIERWPAYSLVATAPPIAANQIHHLIVRFEGGKRAAGLRLFVDGREQPLAVDHDGLAGGAKNALPFHVGESASGPPERLAGRVLELRLFDKPLDRAALTVWSDARLAKALSDLPAEASARAKALAPMAFAGVDDDVQAAREAYDAALEARLALGREVPTVMVMAELPKPRTTRIHVRGRYDEPGEVITPGVPEALLGPWPAGVPRNRLGLAAWLVRPDHPLTARVVVNRLWQQLFGVGLVKTTEDFGVQGELPSHPDLLDWLARELTDNGWRVKPLLRTMVLSATYRQDSTVTAALRERDPENRLLARGPRVRLPAETLRDHLLATAGLLHEEIGGPSVFPYQPADLYTGVVVSNKPASLWKESTGTDRYRRSLYTFWKRTVLHPMMTTFDAPDRETCTARRARTNTPLQALALMNEPGAVEAARLLGTRMLREGGTTAADRLRFAFRLATGRVPEAAELRVLERSLTRFRRAFQANRAGARRYLAIGATPAPGDMAPVELAAAAATASVILNLDATVTKE